MILPKKDPEAAHPVPTAWRTRIRAFVNALASGSLDVTKSEVTCSEATEAYVRANVIDYGETLTQLPEGSWETSQCQWMEGHWEVLVDLWTLEAGRSDLVLFLVAREGAEGRVNPEVASVHVP
jgi:hypothetical protein